MFKLLIITGGLLALITLPGTVELLLLTVAGLLPRNRARIFQGGARYRLAVVVPAHNEELHIARCVMSLLAAGHSGMDRSIVVVADNCDDRTETAALRAGARVLVRTDDRNRGKGFALDFAFRKLDEESWDGFAVVDADSEVSSNFLTEIVAMLQVGADAVQCRYLVRNAGDSARTRLMSVALAAFNVLRPRGRDRCGLSAGIYGNGFALSTATLLAVPYTAASVVEDLEYHLKLLRAGKRVRFANAAVVWGDMPTSGAGVTTQRTRWEGGRLRMIVEKLPGLAAEVFLGKLLFLEPCLDLLLLPLAFHVTLLLLAALTPFWPVRGVALFGMGVVMIHLLAAIHVTGGGSKAFAALLGAPFYMAWKLLLIPQLLRNSKSGTTWVRTERTPKRDRP